MSRLRLGKHFVMVGKLWVVMGVKSEERRQPVKNEERSGGVEESDFNLRGF